MFLLTSFGMQGQVVPDFSMTDTKGVEHNLFNYLGQGKTVVLDFFFVDCTPCQRFTPIIDSIYQSYGGANGDVVVLGISDRDQNDYIAGFEETYGATYPSAGIEGGGDTITELFMGYFPFVGWPTYAVVCPDTSISWALPKGNDLIEMPDTIDACSVSNIFGLEIGGNWDFSLFPNPNKGDFKVLMPENMQGWVEVEIVNSIGASLYSEKKEINAIGELSFNLNLNSGIFWVLVEKDGQVVAKNLIIH
ncbi:MAG: thiol-disulfide isomerase/thioredoxin [Luteibaculaceae bacterium]|jgi:thiol-disulfide isomerase/thioredoxin